MTDLQFVQKSFKRVRSNGIVLSLVQLALAAVQLTVTEPVMSILVVGKLQLAKPFPLSSAHFIGTDIIIVLYM